MDQDETNDRSAHYRYQPNIALAFSGGADHATNHNIGALYNEDEEEAPTRLMLCVFAGILPYFQNRSDWEPHEKFIYRTSGNPEFFKMFRKLSWCLCLWASHSMMAKTQQLMMAKRQHLLLQTQSQNL